MNSANTQQYKRNANFDISVRTTTDNRKARSNIDRETIIFDLSNEKLRPDSALRPLYVGDLRYKGAKKNSTGSYDEEDVVNLLLETFSPQYEQAKEFIITFAAPKSRQNFLHYYEINASSQNASIVLGVSSDKILEGLKMYSKTERISTQVEEFIQRTSSSFGKAKQVLKDNQYFIETEDEKVIDFYRKKPKLKDCWIDNSTKDDKMQIEKGDVETDDDDDLNVQNPKNGNGMLLENIADDNEENPENKMIEEFDTMCKIKVNRKFNEQYENLLQDCEKDPSSIIPKTIYRLQIKTSKIDKLKNERLTMSNEEKFKYMLAQEYDYQEEDENNPHLDIDLKQNVKIRPYQDKALSRMFKGSRARSGVIVLPCGAGKTQVGISAISRIKKRALILCLNNFIVKQWEKQLQDYSTIKAKDIFCFLSDSNCKPLDQAPCVVISTYTMITKNDDQRSAYSREFIKYLGSVEWGVLVLDEVQVAPADQFRRAIDEKTHSHCKLGLTATLVREDNKIDDLQFYLGPKLYEESWIDLTEQGYLARVQCCEVKVPMTDEFMSEYLNKSSKFGKNKAEYLYTGNPNKYQIVQYLIELHKKNDKILIFIDKIKILKCWAEELKYPYICGDTKAYEREKLLQFFQHLPDWNVQFVSRVGDVGIDLPDANVAIEVCSQFGSRRQEAQRLGRILRPKENNKKAYQSTFYSLISKGTSEMQYAMKRQKFQIKQGYSFKSLKMENIKALYSNQRDKAPLKGYKPDEQKRWLESLLDESIQTNQREVFLGEDTMDDIYIRQKADNYKNRVYIETRY